MIRNLVFKGEGVKGIAYIGALKVLEEYGLVPQIRRVAGTSSGAFISTFIALGGKAADLEAATTSETLRRLLDNSRFALMDLSRLITHFGWYLGNELSRWAWNMIERVAGKGDITFSELRQRSEDDPETFKTLSVVATNLSLQAPCIYNAERTPEVPIWESLRASMSIPFLFPSPRDAEGNCVIDGGLVYNYPLDLYDLLPACGLGDDAGNGADADENTPLKKNTNRETLGFIVETRDVQQARRLRRGMPDADIKGLRDYIKAIIGLMADQSQNSFLNPDDWSRTVFIEGLGVKVTDFSIPDEMIAKLVASGAEGTRQFFRRKGMSTLLPTGVIPPSPDQSSVC